MSKRRKKNGGTNLDLYNIYAIELERDVLKRKNFVERNPNYDGEKACLYIGMTSRTPEERLAQHRAGYRASRTVKRFGLHLIVGLGESNLTRKAAERREVELADELRAQGFAVWQN